MDVNNTPYFLLRGAADFEQDSLELAWNPKAHALTLAQNQALRLPVSDPAAALLAWQNAEAMAVDSFGQIGRLSADRSRVQFDSGRGFLSLQDGDLRDVAAPVGGFTDLAFAAVSVQPVSGYGQPAGDGRLALPFSNGTDSHGLLLFHLARRWQTACTWSSLPGEDGTEQLPLRACIDAENRIWLISASRLMLCAGEPLPLPYSPQAVRFEPLQTNPHPLQRLWQQNLPAGWQALAICCDLQQLYVLCHDGAGSQSVLARALAERGDAPFSVYACPAELPFAVDLALAGDSSLPVADGVRLAALAPQAAGDPDFVQRDCPVLSLHWDSQAETGSARLVRERFPMLSQRFARFVASADGQLRYQARSDASNPASPPLARELHALRRPQYFGEGSAVIGPSLDQQRLFDSLQVDTHWHRLYLDACIPSGCAIGIEVRAFADGDGPRPAFIEQAAPVLNPMSSELPFGTGLADAQAGGGLYEILLQRRDGPVRQLRGRYLEIRVSLRGDGRSSPAVHALRLYYPRFCYQENYLPEYLRQEWAPDANQGLGPANGADLRERLLAAFEGVLTPLEGRIAAAEQLVHPDAAPAEHLPWLAEALGGQWPAHWPESRQRRWLGDLTLVQQYKGTLAAVNLALDIASDGGVQRGEIVVMENFRLRRTMATILGIDMDDAEHPLTLGTGMSGNSIVGDSLILSELDAKEFIALFAPELASAEEAAAVKAFFEQYAHQLSVLLHGRAVKLRSNVEAVLAEQLPGHLQYKIIETERPFVLGISPLLGVDTFVETAQPAKRVTLDDTYLGREGVLKNPAAFSPEDINATAH
ncbi:phage tail protein I [Methylomonas rhizoryzae]|uniref:phage tail protein I n=1 Tax=Methylomonas rhizoryzae TaxID=2608981 RepID=UPI001232D489|nr:phage tail protein I [Methylomonas rhizoryzae]